MAAPPPPGDRYATSNVDHSPTSGAGRRDRRATTRGLAAVALGVVLAGVSWLLDDVSATASGVVVVVALVCVLGGCATVLYAARSSRHGGDPGSGGGFTATGL